MLSPQLHTHLESSDAQKYTTLVTVVSDGHENHNYSFISQATTNNTGMTGYHTFYSTAVK